MQIENAVVLVTGANRGIGLAFARELLARGARKVYAAARNPATVTFPGFHALQLDVTKPDQIATAVQQAGDVTLVINNAGIARSVGADRHPVRPLAGSLRHGGATRARSAEAAPARHVQACLHSGWRLRPHHCRGCARERPGGLDRPAVHRQPGSGGAHADRGIAQPLGHGDVLHARRKGLHRLPHAQP